MTEAYDNVHEFPSQAGAVAISRVAGGIEAASRQRQLADVAMEAERQANEVDQSPVSN